MFTRINIIIIIIIKYAWVEPLTSKTGKSLVTAFTRIFKSTRKPLVLQTDQGKEFVNTTFQHFLKTQDIHYFTTYNEEIKASVMERFNRTFKSKMWKYFIKYNTNVFVDVLPELVWSYNHTYHRSIKMQPVEVHSQNQEEVWHSLYIVMDITYKRPKLKWEILSESVNSEKHSRKAIYPIGVKNSLPLTRL